MDVDNENKKRKEYTFWYVVLALIALLSPIILLKFPWCIINLGDLETIGPTIGGITAPFISLIAIWITFKAFWVQYQANNYQKDTNEQQRADIAKERFENNFFQFLELLHKQVVMSRIDGVGEAKQAFHYMFYEFKALYWIILSSKIFDNVENRRKCELEQTFYLFMNGVSESSIARLSECCLNGKKEKLESLNRNLLGMQKAFLENGEKPRYLKDYTGKSILLFDGHRLRLIPYYRTVCMIVQYIGKGIKEMEAENEKVKEYQRFYMNILCSQFTEHEIALLRTIYLYGDGEHVDFKCHDNSVLCWFFEEVLKSYIKSRTMDVEDENFVS